MTATLKPLGDRAILVDLPDEPTRRALDAALRADTSLTNVVVEHIPAAKTVLVRLRDASSGQQVADRLRELLADLPELDDTQSDDTLVVPVTYDGADLGTLAESLGRTERDLVEWHTSRPWRVDFAGFMPGWGYLVRSGEELDIPRLTSPRTRIPAGSVALAGKWSGIYPQASSGGWQLIGRTDLTLWDLSRPEPALLVPGRLIQFEEVR